MSALAEKFDFTDDDVKLKEIEVNLGSRGQYVLREADEGTAIDYRNNAISKTTFEDGKVTGANGVASIEAELVGNCLFPKGSASPVGTAFIRSLPARIVKKLHTWVMDASGLREKEEDELGKGSPNGTGDSCESPAPPG